MPRSPSAAPNLTAVQLVTYSLGGLGMNLTNLVVSQWLFERYVVAGVLAPAVFSFVLLAVLQTQIAVALAGLPVAGFSVLPFALLADVIDLDSEQSRIRREAIYFC